MMSRNIDDKAYMMIFSHSTFTCNLVFFQKNEALCLILFGNARHEILALVTDIHLL